MHRLAVLGLVAVAAAGCANDRLERRIAALTPLVGKSEADLVTSLGVPTRTYQTGGAKFLAYDDKRIDYDPGLPPFAGPWGPYYGWGYYGGIPPRVIERTCETTFEVVSGVVRSFNLRGNACG